MPESSDALSEAAGRAARERQRTGAADTRLHRRVVGSARARARRPTGARRVLRNPGQARPLARWLARALWLRTQRAAGLVRERASGRHRRALYPLGAQIATDGPRAAAVFVASGRVAPASSAEHADVVVVDDRGTGKEYPPGAAVVALSSAPEQLSVPAFDPLSVNPIDWKPRDAMPVPASDVTGEPDPAVRAAALAARAASGAVVCVDSGEPELRPLLGAELHDLMTDGERIAGADAHGREAISIDMRRCALRDHSLRARARQVIAAAGLEASPPAVSVLLATNRPERLEAAVASVAAQNYPNTELVLAPHGAGFTDEALARAVEAAGVPVRIAPVPADEPLGAVLNAAVAASSGTLVAKLDDDDHYSPHHLWDLVLAHEYSQAELVAKGAEYVYVASQDRTLRMFGRRGERYLGYPGVSGGAMLISRHDLAQAGGWRRVPRHVDTELARDVTCIGGRIYRTHGRGYLRVRHGDDHTWNVKESHFTGRATDAREGLDLAFAGIV